jgi:MYXO-CTERM domain-containing protein
VVDADTLVKYTYLGDADLSGSVDFDDYAFIDGSFFGQGSPLLTANISAVPEPSTWVLGNLAMLGLAGAGLRRRRLAVV